MNVLFAGPWDLAGKYMAERFLQEGHSVCWLTREPERPLWDQKLKGSVRRGTFTPAQIQGILRGHRIEVVVWLTGTLREPGDVPQRDHRDRLEEMLEVLKDYPLQSFVYLSSAELAYGGPLTPRQSALAAEELCCGAYRDHHGLPLLLLRMGYLYAADAPLHAGLIADTLHLIRQEQGIACPYHPDDLVDTIQAADAAMALYRMLLHKMSGRYLLVTGHPLPFRTLYTCLEQAAGHPARVEYLEKQNTMTAGKFSSDAIKAATGWMPFFLLQETGWQSLKNVPVCPSVSAPVRPRQRRFRLPRGVVETLVLFLFTCFLLRFGKDVSDLKYVDIRLMFVALSACCYGGGAGLLAIVLAALSYLYSLASSYVDTSYLLYSVDTWVPFVVYAVTGSALGYMTGRRREENQALQRKYHLLEEKCTQLESAQGETMEIKNRLQQRIVAERHGFAGLYTIVRELDGLAPGQILPATVRIVENLLECDRVAVYRFRPDNSARLEACSAPLQGQLPEQADSTRLAALRSAFARQTVFANTELTPGMPDLAAAIRCGHRLYGVVAVYGLDPEHFTTYYRDLLKVLMGLVERNLVRALDPGAKGERRDA